MAVRTRNFTIAGKPWVVEQQLSKFNLFRIKSKSERQRHKEAISQSGLIWRCRHCSGFLDGGIRKVAKTDAAHSKRCERSNECQFVFRFQ